VCAVQHAKDLSILSERTPYLHNEVASEYVLFKDRDWIRRFDARELPPARFTSGRTSVLEHLRRAILNVPLGPHGLPRMEDGDWNDALNGMQFGESVMNAGPYAFSLLKLKALYRALGDTQVNALLPDGSYAEDLRRFDASYRAMKDAVNRHAWDGDWYVRGFDNEGVPFGSRRNDEGKIYLNAQSWAILGGIPDAERTNRILASVNRYLIKNDKATLLAPVYTRRHANIGAITLLPKGSNENGGQWRQCTLWWIAALLEHGRRAAAVRMLDSVVLANADPVVMGTEPYLYNEYVRGPEAVHPGSGGQQAHVQQAALVLHTLGQSYPLVGIVRNFAGRYDYPGAPAEAKLTSITGQGEVVDWAPKWIENPPDYEIVRVTSRR
jgi:cellobiose phosphorylase